jgi:hypothetical protein
VYNMVNGTCLCSKSTVGSPGYRPADSRLRRKTSIICHMYTLLLVSPDDGLQSGPKHVEAW